MIRYKSLSHHFDREQQPKSMLLPKFGFDLCPMKRVIECVFLSSLPTRGHFGSLATSGSLLVVWCEMFFLRAFSNRTCKPFTLGFLGALNGSDTSRTQAALGDYVNRSWSACERKAKRFQCKAIGPCDWPMQGKNGVSAPCIFTMQDK